jgi:hypothetical protein
LSLVHFQMIELLLQNIYNPNTMLDKKEGRPVDPQQPEQLEGRSFHPRAPPSVQPPEYRRPLQLVPPRDDWRHGPSKRLAVHAILNPIEPEGIPSSHRVSETESLLFAVSAPTQVGANTLTASQHDYSSQHLVNSTPLIQPSYSATVPTSRPTLTPTSPQDVALGRGREPKAIDTALSSTLDGRSGAYTPETVQSTLSYIPLIPNPPIQTQSQRYYRVPATVLAPPETITAKQASSSDPFRCLMPKTSQDTHHVPVNVYEGLLFSNEKRARKAGPAPRVRQTGKDKERETNMTIKKMQAQNEDLERRVRELEQERDFYRRERDRFRDTVFRRPEMHYLAMQGVSSQ